MSNIITAARGTEHDIVLIGLTRKLADVSHSDFIHLHNLYIYAMLNPRGSVIAGGRVYSPDSTALGGGFRVEASGWGRNAKEEEEEKQPLCTCSMVV